MINPFAIPALGKGRIPDTIVWAVIWIGMVAIVIGDSIWMK